MDIFVADAESFYDTKQKYGLRTCTTEEYINDPKFHCFGFAFKKNSEKSFWVPGEQLVEAFNDLELHKHAVIAHNAPFDMAIMNWKYGVRPKFIIDTLSMARALLGTEERLSLAALAERFGLGVKGDTVLHMDGVRHPDAYMARKLGEYACNDADLEWELWLKIKSFFPLDELKTIDMTVRMFTEPSFVLDPVPIEREIYLGEERKELLLTQAGCGLDDLRSDPKFAAVLESLGVTPPMKLSAKKSAKAGEPVYAYAFAKSDADFKALAESDNDLVRWACEARLGLKSTIKASRSMRFRGIQERMGVMPIALDYGGAGTLRYAASSSAKVNAQNLPAARGSDDPDVALLRAALCAPEGKQVVVADLSQIEARIVVWLAGQDNVVSAFAEGRDVYSEMASVIFGRHVDRKKVVEDFIAGFIGKAVVLGCGYGLGHMKFAAMIYSGMLGAKGILFDEKMAADVKADLRGYAKFISSKPDMLEKLKELQPAKLTNMEWLLHVACAFKIISTFRERNAMIPRLWRTCDTLLEAMLIGDGRSISFTDANGDEIITLKTRKDAVLMPSGMWMHFKALERDDEGNYTCMRRKEGRVKRVKVYGGSVLENCIAEGTLVLTDSGWCPIETVKDSDLVHDGVEFVAHGGVVFKSDQKCVIVDGVNMTPDHEVLTNEGWKAALEKPRPHRPDIRSFDRCAPSGERWEENEMGVQVSVRGTGGEGWNRRHEVCEARAESELRVCCTCACEGGKHLPRNELASSVLGLAKYARSVQVTVAQSVGKLRRARDYCVPGVGEFFRALLGRHAAWLRVWAHPRSERQFAGVLQGELPLGFPQSAGQQPPEKSHHIHAARRDDSATSCGEVQYKPHHNPIPSVSWVATRGVAQASEVYPVYDIVNAGPRSRFVVLGTDGPFVVHNCSQNLAGIIVRHGMVLMNDRYSHRPILQVHDEVVAISGEAGPKQTLDEMIECMTDVPVWAKGLPLAAEGGFGKSYRDAK